MYDQYIYVCHDASIILNVGTNELISGFLIPFGGNFPLSMALAWWLYEFIHETRLIVAFNLTFNLGFSFSNYGKSRNVSARKCFCSLINSFYDIWSLVKSYLIENHTIFSNFYIKMLYGRHESSLKDLSVSLYH